MSWTLMRKLPYTFYKKGSTQSMVENLPPDFLKKHLFKKRFVIPIEKNEKEADA